MALIVCPECGKNFSDRAQACPECGFPTAEIIGKGCEVQAGQISIANIAFDDGRYDEAYSIFAQLYAQNPSNVQVVIRFGLSVVAKDYFSNGIPNSTKELLEKGVEIIKVGATNQEDFISKLMPYIKDVQKVIDNTNSVLYKEVSSVLNQTTPMRSTGQMVSDVLFAPAVVADRNLYEDRRTAENNIKIIKNAVENKEAVTATIEAFMSYVLNLVAKKITESLDNEHPLYIALGDFVKKKEDLVIYENLSAKRDAQADIYGLCWGKEKTIIDFENNTSYLRVNGKPHATGFRTPSGHLILTNYKVKYTANPEKFSFEKSLKDLISVEVGGPAFLPVLITLVFPNNTKVYISPKEPGNQALYVGLINAELKM